MTTFAINYYVNDASTNGDVYASAIGCDTNNGTSPSSPKLNITNLMATYTIQPGDIVYIDTGIYSNNYIRMTSGGSAGLPIVFQGSTNYAAGGTILDRNDIERINVYLYTAPYIVLRNLILKGGKTGVYCVWSPNCQFYRIITSDKTTGFYCAAADDLFFKKCIAFKNTTGVRSDNQGVIWEQGICYNNTLGFDNTSGSIAVTNSVFMGGKAFGEIPDEGDYNVFWETTFPGLYQTLSDIQQKEERLTYSIVADPLFVDPENYDFHVKSIEGSYSNGVWTAYSNHSPCIDFGYPGTLAWTNEPDPDGERINVGFYGGTEEASKSDTNPWLQVISFNDGGTLQQTGVFRWVAGNLPTTSTARIGYSFDNGDTWSNIVTGYAVTNEYYIWNATGFPSSLMARWRIESELPPYVSDTNDVFFAVRTGNQGVCLYVNDTNTNGDVYCTVAGSSDFDGLSSNTPITNPQLLVDMYELGPGDEMFIDTGIYTNTLTIPAFKDGTELAPLRIVGSTNWFLDGSIMERRDTGEDVLRLEGACYLHVENLALCGGRMGLYAQDKYGEYPHGNIFNNVMIYSNQSRGVMLDQSYNNIFNNCGLVRNSIGFYITGDAELTWSNVWNNGIAVSNNTAFNISSETLTISNSIIVGGTAFASDIPFGDYNVIWDTSLKTGYATLSEIQETWDTWWYSVYADPGFYNVNGLDFHLISPEGRYNPSITNYVTNDTDYSIAIDFADPSSGLYTNEYDPNGTRLNAGIYGGTSQASKSRTNTWLQVLTFNDGGVLNAQNDRLYWNAGGYTNGETITLLFSRDSGVSWNTIATNIAIEDGSYLWSNTNFFSSYYSKWRIVYNNDSNTYSQTDNDFLYKNGPFTYYVNDSTTNGDVYCAAIGNDSYLGVSPETPKASLRVLLDTTELTPGDIVYVDTGTYIEPFSTTISGLDSGTNGAPVSIQGSTNYAFGGTRIRHIGSGLSDYVIYFSQSPAPAHDVTINDVHITGGGQGFCLERAYNIVLHGVLVSDVDYYGLNFVYTSNSIVKNGYVSTCDVGIRSYDTHNLNLQHLVLWKNQNSAIEARSGVVTLSNSVITCSGLGMNGYYVHSGASLLADYNVIIAKNNATVGYVQASDAYAHSLPAWRNIATQDIFSFSTDPLFADPDAGDFHLKTEVILGRRTMDGDLTTDLVTSPLIDSGAPLSAYLNEPEPNGQRANIGMYGNTWQASVRFTNHFLYAATFREGGWARDNEILHWIAGGDVVTQSLKIEYSVNGGNSWLTLSNSLDAASESCAWITTNADDTPAALWRISSESNTNLFSETTNFFSIRNNDLNIFINDSEVTNDVYTDSVGGSTNWQATSNAPLDSIERAVRRFDLEPGDKVWVDTGIYTNEEQIIQIGFQDSGSSLKPVSFIGSTNAPYTSSVIYPYSGFAKAVIDLNRAQYMVFSNLVLRGAKSGMSILDAHDISLSCRFSHNKTNGCVIGSSSNILYERSIFDNNGTFGLVGQQVDVDMTHCLVFSNDTSQIDLEGGVLSIYNSFIAAGRPKSTLFSLNSSVTVDSDYNAFSHLNGAWVARIDNNILKYLSDWQTYSSNDYHTLTCMPDFAAWGNGDYHLKSMYGRWENGLIVTDEVVSVLIDTGDPGDSFMHEPEPNGNRVNIGLYGNTHQASISSTNPWLRVLSLNDGGSIKLSNHIYWVCNDSISAEDVYIDYSGDGGSTWVNIATNITAGQESFLWNTTNYPNTSLGVWRITSENDSSVYSQSENLFAIKNEPIGFFVNDNSTNGDVYATAIGLDSNNGLRPSSPKRSLQAIIDTYMLDPGDVIYIDTGSYDLENDITLQYVTGGITNPLIFRGSTNWVHGGTVFNNAGFNILNSEYISIDQISISNALRGVRLYQSRNCMLSNVWVANSSSAFVSDKSSGCSFNHCIAQSFLTNGFNLIDSTNLMWRNGIFKAAGFEEAGSYITTGTCVQVEDGDLTISNSVFLAYGRQDKAIELLEGATLHSDYNNFFMTNSEILVIQKMSPSSIPEDFYYDTINMWRRYTDNDQHSLAHEPGFAGSTYADYSLFSQAGRYDALTDMVVTDSLSSIMIDAGNPIDGYLYEPEPNGGRINMGYRADTYYASRTPTNSKLTVVTLYNGGIARGTNCALRWLARGNLTSSTVSLYYSPNGGSVWSNLASGIPSTNEYYSWNTTSVTSSFQGVWSVQSDDEPSVFDQSIRLFSVRNDPAYFYVNDSVTNGDVYTTDEGHIDNDGLSPGAPKLSLGGILDAYDLEPGDVVYMDTGLYNDSDLTITQLDSGDQSAIVTFIGSTNFQAGGTVFSNIQINIHESRGVEFKNVIFNNQDKHGLVVGMSTNTSLQRCYVYDAVNAFVIQDSISTYMTHCLAVGAVSNGLLVSDSMFTFWENGVMWSNNLSVAASIAAQIDDDNLSCSNSVFVASAESKYIYDVSGTTLSANYNNYIYSGATLLGTKSHYPIPIYCDNLSQWSRVTGLDDRSFRVSPGFADPLVGDFHPKSQAGRVDVGSGLIVTDLTTSILIDAGGIGDGYANEPQPNGGRRNIGLFGDAVEASRSPTNPSLTLLSLQDGGFVSGTNQYLRWLTRGLATGHTVRIAYSPDKGSTWVTLATNYPAAAEYFVWDTTTFMNTMLGRWALFDEDEPSVEAVSEIDFAVRNGPMYFYVNDGSISGDVYTTSIGLSTNLGLTSNAPMLSLSLLVDTYDFEGGDIIYVDTGTYDNYAPINITFSDSAVSTNDPPVVFQGSTNSLYGGTVLDMNGALSAFTINNALSLIFKNLNIRNASQSAFMIDSAYNIEFEWVDIMGGGEGFNVIDAEAVIWQHCSIHHGAGHGLNISDSQDLQWLNGVIWSNSDDCISFSGSQFDINNSVFGVYKPSTYVFKLLSDNIISDFNCFYITNEAGMADCGNQAGGGRYLTVSRWVRDHEQDIHSFAIDPAFVDESNGDFHLKSQAGHVCVTSEQFVVDSITSPLIDAGDPGSHYTNEVSPNGNRINIGLYGNTRQASLSPTNPALTVISLNDGGRTEGLMDLHWHAQGDATNDTLLLEVSTDEGITWEPIYSGIDAAQEHLAWNTTLYPSSIISLWRISSLENPSVSDMCDSIFALRNDPLYFYVNDYETADDVYCQNPGFQTNYGITAFSPKPSLKSLLNMWDIEPGDIIYIDTGSYLDTVPTVIDEFDAGLPTNNVFDHVRIIGSTNQAYPSSLFYSYNHNNILELDNAVGISLSWVSFFNANRAVKAENSSFFTAEFLRFNNCDYGLELNQCSDSKCEHSLLSDSKNSGVVLNGSSSGLTWKNGVLWSNRVGFMVNAGKLAVYNSAMVSFNDNSVLYQFDANASITSWYNNISLYDDALCAVKIIDIYTNRYKTVASLFEREGLEINTSTLDPLFYNPSQGDFHIMSSTGRYQIGVGWTNDSESSRLIDRGDLSPYYNEPPINGGVINVGMYGNTPWASITPPEGWLICLSQNDGGSVQGVFDLLWEAGWVATGHVVFLDYSPDDGVTWTNIVTNWPASTEQYTWDSTDYGRSALGRWRITSHDDPSVNDTNDARFSLRNGGSIPYYVNDSSTNGDVYCTAIGDPGNDGLQPDVPLDSIQSVLNMYDLDPSDEIYVDSGTYNLSHSIAINDYDSGWDDQYVRIIGSTNPLAASRLVRPLNAPASIIMRNTWFFKIANLVCEGGVEGVRLEKARDCVLENIHAVDNTQYGIKMSEANTITFNGCLVQNAGSGDSGFGIDASKSTFSWHNGIIWACQSGVRLNSSYAQIQNSIIEASGAGANVFYLGSGASLDSDYNNLYTRYGAYIGRKQISLGGDDFYPNMIDWQNATGDDEHSSSMNPLFVNDLTGDFHLQSTMGRWADGGYTNFNDDSMSPMIDFGDPLSTYTNETDPNGNRVNLGIYGNSRYASLSSTNPWLLALSLNDGGVLSGTNTLRWNCGNLSTGTTVRLQYSQDREVSWETIVSNLPHNTLEYEWDVSALALLSHVKWRIVYEADTNLFDASDNYFAIKNGSFSYYINDNSRDGDVFTDAVGQPDNDALDPATPLDSPATLLAMYPIGQGDVIYIDTGSYTVNSNAAFRFDAFTRGTEFAPITVLGSTNWAYGGTIINKASSGYGLYLRDTRYINCDHLNFSNANDGVYVRNSQYCTFTNVHISLNSGNGFVLNTCRGVTLDRCSSWMNTGKGLVINASFAPAHSWNNGVIWSNRGGAIDLVSAKLNVRNSILHAYYTNTYIYTIDQFSTLDADFNMLSKVDPAHIGRDTSKRITLRYLSEWYPFVKCDYHSFLEQPFFHDPGNGDFHLNSVGGRYQGGSFVSDPVTSWAIDAGGYDDSYVHESSPNGSRINLGLYGNTPYASRSDVENPEVLLVTLKDGGTMWDSAQPIYWLFRGLSPTNSVRLDYSWNNGGSWLNIASNINIDQHDYVWLDTNPSSPTAKLKLTVEGNTGVTDESDTYFVKRTGPIYFYVNDNSTNGDVYTSEIGLSTNTGFKTNEPKSSISQVINEYPLRQGDIIFVDTGVYTPSASIQLGAGDSGSNTSSVRIVGSPFYKDTIIDWQDSSTYGFLLDRAKGYSIENMMLTGADTAFKMDNQSTYCTLVNCLLSDGESDGVVIAAGSGPLTCDKIIITRFEDDGIDIKSGVVDLNRCIIWENGKNAINVAQGGRCILSNSIVSTSGEDYYCYNFTTNAPISSDYNILFVTNGAHYARYNGMDIDGLPQWVAVAEEDVFSLACDPLFIDPTNDDFHVRSQHGRYDPAIEGYVYTDSNVSYAVDMAASTMPYENEPEPNGNRCNIGYYGNSAHASLSATNPWLRAITGMSGGQLKEIVLLAWQYGNVNPGNIAVLDYSYDNGVTWTNIGKASLSENIYLWMSNQKYGEIERWFTSPLARWRISLESDTNIYDITDSPFTLRNKLIQYYLNDTSQVNDVYTSAPGNDTNLGFFAWSPKATLKNLMSSADLEGEDSVLIDTGIYSITTNNVIDINPADQGKNGLPVTFIGNTNAPLSIFEANEPLFSPIINAQGSYFDFKNLTFLGSGISVHGDNCSLSKIDVTNGSVSVVGMMASVNDVAVVQGNISVVSQDAVNTDLSVRHGHLTFSGTNMSLYHSLVVGSNALLTLAGENVAVSNSTIVSDDTAVNVANGSVSLRNSIVIADGEDNFCFLTSGGYLDSDYNNVVSRNDAWIGNVYNKNWETLLYWQRTSGNDLHSISAEPLFVNESGYDFHVQSIEGHWTPTGWVNDLVMSPCIDMGAPTASATNEVMPNGGIVNLGRYGNAAQASKSSVDPWLYVMSMNDGGVLKGTNLVRWRSGNIDPAETIRLEYSEDGGSTWITNQSGIFIGYGEYDWDTTTVPSSLYALWRIVLESDPLVYDQCDSFFAVRNSNLVFYVNDDSLMNDVYCSAVGSSSNSGLSNSAPMNSIIGILDQYDTEGGDIIKVDTGIYDLNENIDIIWSRGGDADSGVVSILGSTNVLSYGSILNRDNFNNGARCMTILASYMRIEDLVLTMAYNGIVLQTNEHCFVRNLSFVSNRYALVASDASSVTVLNNRVWSTLETGFDFDDCNNLSVQNSTFVDFDAYAIALENVNNVDIQNSIFYTTSEVARVFAASSYDLGNMFLDYNIYYLPQTQSVWSSYQDLLSWQLDWGHDYRSAFTNPLFADIDIGDFHMQSEQGRFLDGIGWVVDGETSWSVDRGNPLLDYSLEPQTNGNRINIGAYGNTPFASKGTTNSYFEIRSLNESASIDVSNSLQLLLWTTHEIPQGTACNVEFSGDGGQSWVALTNNVDAYREYYLWQTTPYFNTYKGMWRISSTNGQYIQTNASPFEMFYGEYEITDVSRSSNLLNSIIWRGAWDERYVVEYTTNLIEWTMAPSGSESDQTNDFTSVFGGDFTYEDIGSTSPVKRMYRINNIRE